MLHQDLLEFLAMPMQHREYSLDSLCPATAAQERVGQHAASCWKFISNMTHEKRPFILPGISCHLILMDVTSAGHCSVAIVWTTVDVTIACELHWRLLAPDDHW